MLLWMSLALADATTTYQGNYKIVENASQIETTLNDAVTKAAAQFNPVTRLVAEPRLREAATVCTVNVLNVTPDNFSSKCDDLPVLNATLNGGAITWQGKGDPLKVTTQRQGDTVRVIYTSETGTRTNIWKFAPDGTASLTVIVASSSLTEPMKWTLHYVAK